MGMINNLFDKIKNFFNKRKNLNESSKPTIVIRERHDIDSEHYSQSFDEGPRITIREVHREGTTATGDLSEVEVQTPNLGHGITVKKQHKPSRCPMCATKGKVVANPSGRERWKCEECGSTFN